MTLTRRRRRRHLHLRRALNDDDRDLIHQILDLEAGDRIVVKQYQIRRMIDGDPTNDGDDDPFDRTYGDDGDDAGRPFRFRIEKIGDDDRTFVDVYVQQNDEKDYSIEIQGSSQAVLLPD